MKRVLGIIAVLIPLCLLAEGKTIYFDKKWKVTDSANASYYRHVTKQPDGKFKVEDYYLTGKLQMTGCYRWLAPHKDSGIEDGRFVYYDSLGFVKKIFNHKNGKPVGTWQFFYDHSKILKEEHRFINDTTDNCIGYDSIAHKRSYEGKIVLSKDDGWQKTGLWTFYYRDGKTIEEVALFLWGRRNGQSTSYDSATHSITECGLYRFGLIHGTWRYYYPGTNIIRRIEYVDPDPRGIEYCETDFYKSGRIRKISEPVRGRSPLDHISTCYTEDGQYIECPEEPQKEK